MNILAVGAHPDDLEILMGGTLAKYAARGDRVFMASLTNGNMGHPRYKPDDMAIVRKSEMEASAAIIGAEVIWMDVDDEFSEISLQARLMMVDVLRQASPDVIFTHGPTDYHVDHRNCGQLVFEAAPLACVHNIVRALPQLDKQPLIYHMDNLAGICFEPTEFVDVSDFLEIKKAMFRCHKSQDSWMLEITGFDVSDVIETCAKFRGYHAGVRNAEAFRRVDAWYRGTTKRVLP
jgi:N-acetylglucosamine malate deacetylase 1